MNKNLLNGIKDVENLGYTENGGVKRKSTLNAVYDMFAWGGSYRSRTTEEKINLFKTAYKENKELALKCLFYLRDILEGQGERQFFKDCYHWLAKEDSFIALKFMPYISDFGRWDDMYCLVDTPVEEYMFKYLNTVFRCDMNSKTPSLLGKWLKSINTSSAESRALGAKTAKAFGLNFKQYRKALARLRTKINIVEKLMCENRWEEIEFDKIPSKAGIKYANAFARRDIIKQKYKTFMASDETKVNAKALYPVDVVHKAMQHFYHRWGRVEVPKEEQLVIEKYWNNLTDYFNGATFDGVAVVDTSGSMTGTPLEVAMALGIYCAEKVGKGSPFYKHYISFSRKAKLVEVKGDNLCEKVKNIYDNSLIENTNIESVFDLILSTALENDLSNEDIPKNVIIISDMEFDECSECHTATAHKTVMERIIRKFNSYGYTIPHLVFWNVDARSNNIPMKEKDGVTFVSGYSPVVYDMIMKGKTGIELMKEKLLSDRYSKIAIK